MGYVLGRERILPHCARGQIPAQGGVLGCTTGTRGHVISVSTSGHCSYCVAGWFSLYLLLHFCLAIYYYAVVTSCLIGQLLPACVIADFNIS